VQDDYHFGRLPAKAAAMAGIFFQITGKSNSYTQQRRDIHPAARE
jgi:hypothetical protein